VPLPDVAGWRLTASLAVLAALLLWESIAPFFQFHAHDAHPLRIRARHGAINIAYGVVNGLAIRFVFLALWTSAMVWSATHQIGLLHRVIIPANARVLAALLLLDLWGYLWHRLNHTVPAFWRFHRTHHADAEMDVTTANRFHIGEIVLSSLLRVPVLAVIGCSVQELALYELLLFAVVQFHHANIGLPDWLDRSLRVVIVTPHLHKVHHSIVVADQHANYSSLFSWWDRVARTWRLAPDPTRITLGVDDARS
jgi:sterol desaturase/sphingolipid hydroxylase (fatty acid hydroxylase superfamily)